MKKIIMVAVMVALFAGAVGVGVHVLNKEAHAISTYTVECLGWVEGNPKPGVTIKFCIVGEQPRFVATDANGIASTTTATPQAWTAEISDADWAYRNLDPYPANCTGPMTVTWGVIAI